jgi:hypothetical protein
VSRTTLAPLTAHLLLSFALLAHLQTLLSEKAFQLLMVEIKKIAAISRAGGGDINDVGQVGTVSQHHRRSLISLCRSASSSTI